MEIITLTDGSHVAVDDRDFATLSDHRWHRNSHGYAVRYENRRAVLMHRVIVAAPQGQRVDHADGDRLNNTRANLRLCTHSQNIANQSGHRGRRAKFKGIEFDRRNTLRPYRARITANGVRYWLGCFRTEEEAARCYDSAALSLFGEFARPNFPTQGSPM